MLGIEQLCRAVIDENVRLLAYASRLEVERFVQELDNASRIFCAAQGRSGYVLRCFCMRLMHLGYRVHFVGETTAPRIETGDVLVVLSRSGRTACTHTLVKLAQDVGARACGVVGRKDSPMIEDLDCVVCLPVTSENRASCGEIVSVQPLGSLFEQASFVLLESVVLGLFKRQGGNDEALFERHTNLE